MEGDDFDVGDVVGVWGVESRDLRYEAGFVLYRR